MIRLARPGAGGPGAGPGGPAGIPLARDEEAEKRAANRDLALKVFSFILIVTAIRVAPNFLGT